MQRSPRGLGALIGRDLGLVLVGAFVLVGCSAPPSATPGPTFSRPVPLSEATPLRTFHLAPGGSDEATGGSADPWRTWSHALQSLSAGDVLLVHGGEWTERVVGVELAAGSPDRPIVVRSVPGESPVLRGLLWLEDPDHWIVDGIEVTWDPDTGEADDHMVKVTGGTGWVIRNSEFHGARSYAALLVAEGAEGEPSSWSVVANCVHDTVPTNDVNQDHLVYVNAGTGSGPGLIAGNLLFGAPNGTAIKLGGARRDAGGAADVLVARNTIVDTAQNILVAWATHGVVIERNLLGNVQGDYGNVRGFELDGLGNVVRDNVGFGAGRLVLNDRGHRGVEDGGGNVFPAEVSFDRTGSCDGYRPVEPLEPAVGHTTWDHRGGEDRP